MFQCWDSPWLLPHISAGQKNHADKNTSQRSANGPPCLSEAREAPLRVSGELFFRLELIGTLRGAPDVALGVPHGRALCLLQAGLAVASEAVPPPSSYQGQAALHRL